MIHEGFGNKKLSVPETVSGESSIDKEELSEQSQDFSIESDSNQVEQAARFLGDETVVEIRRIVSELHESIGKMLEPVLEKIENGEFQLLIGDDTSGRIPALIVRKIINVAYENTGRPKIPTHFIAGTSIHSNKEGLSLKELELGVAKKEAEISAYIAELKTESSLNISDALIVTEFIESGEGLIPVIKALQGNNITPVILTTNINSYKVARAMETELNVPLVSYGKKSPVPPSLFDKKDLSGVAKHYFDLHAKPIRLGISEDERKMILAKMTIARDEADRVADKLVAELLLT
ncbi:hypothetical protein IPH92_03060 [Candidatus Kaiserbacteria bacterium]|nr:MAG: hypothetical protein IPH92_03060 [Candidatus Kaiserbacteria bacterium]